MLYYADLHVHSRFSRATARDTTLEDLSFWARKKGLSVLGTGDFTHPQWFDEIKKCLTEAEPGFFRLRNEMEHAVDERLRQTITGPVWNTASPRFVLQAEVATIYKKGKRTRKVHHLIMVPELRMAETIGRNLAKIGNVQSDGRPMLGLDSRNLLEIVLESGRDALFVPAHVWTPWFSIFGSKSGFDSVEECYGDLSPHIFALETGLSSDPAMNRRISKLDRYRLISCSDAHSPQKLAREATVFNTRLCYPEMYEALKTGNGFEGTLEFYPEEGKYHLDGHRKCGRRMTPAETKRNNGKCPVCGKPVTVGVLHRIDDLADRRPDYRIPPGGTVFRSFMPLDEVLGQVLRKGPSSKTVRTAYDDLLCKLGPELTIFEDISLIQIERISPVLAEAMARIRSGRVEKIPGFDGEYGKICVLGSAGPDKPRGQTKFSRRG